MVLRDRNLETKLGLVFLPSLHSNHPQIIRCYPHSKERQYTYSNQLGKFETIILWFRGSFAIWDSDAIPTHLPHRFTPTNTCPIKNSNGKCLGYVAFECHAYFHNTWESFVHKDQQRTCLGYVAPKPQRWQMSNFGWKTSFIVNKLRPHSHIWINPKIANFFESKLSMG